MRLSQRRVNILLLNQSLASFARRCAFSPPRGLGGLVLRVTQLSIGSSVGSYVVRLSEIRGPLIFALLTLSSTAWAGDEEVQRARTHFRTGVELHQKGELEAAYVEFQRAHELAPNYQVLFNIGQTASTLKYHGAAYRAFYDYLQEGGENVPEEKRASVTARLEELSGLVGKLHVKCTTGEGELYVDARAVGECPTDVTTVVSAGQHEVSLEVGNEQRRRSVHVLVGERSELTFQPEVEVSRAPEVPSEPEVGAEPEPVLSAEPSVEPQVSDREYSPSAGLWWGLAATGVLGITAGTMGGVALAEDKNAEDLAREFGVNKNTLESANRRASGYALASDVFLGAALVAAGATVALELTLWSQEKEKARGESALKLGLGVNQLRVSGSF